MPDPSSSLPAEAPPCNLTDAFRVLVTGSRTWDNLDAVWGALKALADEHGSNRLVIVHGHCPTGADKLANDYGLNYGIAVERHPARWTELGKRAGFARNAEMVALGADVCLAFIVNASRGASHTADLAEKAGIPTRRYERTTHV